MSADVLRRAAALMQERSDSNTCCGDIDCDDNWYARFLTSVADWLEWFAGRVDSSNDIPAMRGLGLEQALAVARAYLGESS